MLQACELRQYEEGDIILGAGEVLDRMYIVAAGRCARALDTALFDRSSISCMIFKLGGRGLIVLVRDVGHCVLHGITKSLKR